MSLRIGIDVDEVVADLHTSWLARWNVTHGQNVQPSDIRTWDIERYTGKGIFNFLTPDIYDEVKPCVDAWRDVEEARRLGSIFFVSNCRGKGMKEAKITWLIKHGFLDNSEDWRFIPTIETKAHAPVDILIDDHVPNVNEFPSFALLVNRPHNASTPTFRHRIPSLGAALPYIRQLTSPCRCAKQ